MRKGALIAIVLLLFCLSITTYGCKPAKEEKEKSGVKGTPYKIGAVLSLGGGNKELDQLAKNVIELEVEKLNKQGGIKGHPVEVVIKDDGADSTKAVTVLTELIDQDQVIAIIGPTSNDSSMAALADIERAQIPIISLAGASFISAPVKKWVFQAPWPNGLAVSKTFNYLKNKGIKRIGLLFEESSFGSDGKREMEEKAEEYGLEVVSSESYVEGEKDITSQLAKIKGVEVDTVLVWGAGKVPAVIAKDMKQMSMDILYVGAPGIAGKKFIKEAGTAAEGAVFPTGKIMVPETYGEGSRGDKLARQFIKDYKDEYGSEPDGTFAAHAYDGVHIVFDALKRIDKLPDEIDSRELRDTIEKTKGLVLTGGIFNYSEADHYGTKQEDLIMVKVEGQKFVRVEK